MLLQKPTMTKFAARSMEMISSDASKYKSEGDYAASVESWMYKEPLRFIKKSGHINVGHLNVDRKYTRFINDIFTTGVDLKWRWNLLLFSAAFIFSWVGFASVYYVISFMHGDFSLLNTTNDTEEWCIRGLDQNKKFVSMFLFSLETQTTIGYGGRSAASNCGLTIFTVIVQSVFGCVLDAFMIGLIMAKVMRPKKRAETLLYSKCAVINMRNNQLCFMFRVGNMRKSHLVEASIKMQMVRSRVTREGEHLPLEQVDMELDLTGDADRLFLVTPQTICHVIDENSPLWELNRKELEEGLVDFEIIVLLEGMVEATGMMTQARASYLPSEIRWGHRLQNVIKYQKSRGYKVQFPKFHSVIPVNGCPTSSAKKLHEEKELNDSRRDLIRFSIGRSSGTDVRSTSSSSLENSNSDISNF